jgi:hypothetical protein
MASGTERSAAIQLAAGAAQHTCAARLGVGAREREQARLADAGVAST